LTRKGAGSVQATVPSTGQIERHVAADDRLDGIGTLVSRFRSSYHCMAHSFTNFGIERTLANL
jgi:hypothetical protein